MKRLLLTIFAVAVLSFGASAQDSKVYFIRVSYWSGLMGNFKAFVDDSLVCNLNNHRYSVHSVRPGKHKFTVQLGGKASKSGTNEEALFLTTEPGKTYYIALMYESIGVKGNLFCEELTEPSGKRLLSRCESDDCK